MHVLRIVTVTDGINRFRTSLSDYPFIVLGRKKQRQQDLRRAKWRKHLKQERAHRQLNDFLSEVGTKQPGTRRTTYVCADQDCVRLNRRRNLVIGSRRSKQFCRALLVLR